MQISRLETAIALAKHRTVNATAAALGIAPSSVSDRIRQLESEVGVALFTRSARGTRPTPGGARFLAQVGPLIASLRAAVAELREATPTLVIGALPALATDELAPLMATYASRFPDRSVELRPNADRAILLTMLSEGEVDAVVLLDTGDALGELGFATPRDDLEHVDLRAVRMVTVADPQSPLARMRVSIDTLRSTTVLLGQERRCSYWMATQHWLGADTPLTAVGGIPQIKAWVKDGRGVAVLPDFAVHEDLATGSLRELSIATPPLQMRLVWRRGEDSRRSQLRDLLYAISTR